MIDGIGTLGQLQTMAVECERGVTSWCAVDTETTGLHPFSGDVLRGISLATKNKPDGLYFPLTHPDEENNLPFVQVLEAVQRIVDTGVTLVWHHCVFDWMFLSRHGGIRNVDRFPFVDTKVFLWLWDENRTSGLKPASVEFFGGDADAEQRALNEWWDGERDKVRARVREAKAILKVLRRELAKAPEKQKLDFAGVYDGHTYNVPVMPESEQTWAPRAQQRIPTADDKWPVIPAWVIAPYAAEDAFLTRRLAQYFNLIDSDQPFPKGYRRELQMQQVVYRLNVRGLPVDAQALRDAEVSYLSRMSEIEAHFEGKIENLGSSKQKCAYLYEAKGLTPLKFSDKTGAPSASKEALDDYPDDPEVLLLSEYGTKDQGVKMFTKPMLRFISDDGRIHPHFWTTKTVTGRLVCTDPNLMTIPKESSLPEVKAAIVAKPGRKLYRFDLAGAELRVIASHTGDPVLTSAILEGRDLHAETAQAIFGTSEEPYRGVGKNVNFSIPYEAGPNTLAKYVIKAGLPRATAVQQAEAIIEGHRKLFPKLHAVKDKLTAIARRDGKIPLHVPGRYRHFRSPGLWDPRYYTAMNAIVQGGIGEFVKDIMLTIEGFRGDVAPALATWLLYDVSADGLLDVEMVLQVHDELYFEGPDVEGLDDAILRYLNNVSAVINPFRLPMFWEKH